MNELVPFEEIQNALSPNGPKKSDIITGEVSGGKIELTLVEKAAVVLAAVGPEAASDFLRGMSEGNLRRFAKAYARFERIAPEVLQVAIEDFMETLGDENQVKGGIQGARKILGSVLEPGSFVSIMSEVEGPGKSSVWDKLADCSEVALAAFLEREHPQTAAVVITEIRTEKAAKVLEKMDAEFAQQTVFRLSRMPTLEKSVLEMVKQVIERDFLAALQKELATKKPANVIGSLMNNVSAESRETFLERLEEKEPELTSEVLRVMFTFADIVDRVSARDVSSVTRVVEEEVLMIALKSALGTGLPTAGFILSNLPKRLSERIQEDLDAMPDVKLKDGEAAQAEIIRAIQDMEKKGEIVLIESDDE